MVNEELKPQSHANGHDSLLRDNPEKFQIHWKEYQEKRGLGDLLCKASHIAITVSDVGKSVWFYSEVLGLPQIRRPDFNRHGAWLTMGNIELHLILGQPQVPSGDNLIVSHISLETNNITEVLRRLKEMKIPFQTSVLVPIEGKGFVTQFFLRDPDGYYIELCNCDILTEFCYGDGKVSLEGCNESGTKCIALSLLSKIVVLSKRAKIRNDDHKRNVKEILAIFDKSDYKNVKVDEEKLHNLMNRTKIWGDLVQGETEESLKITLQKTSNSVPDAIKYIKAKHGDQQIFQPPTIYINNEEAKVPEPVSLSR